MRQVKARLLKFGFEEEDDSDHDKPSEIPQPPPPLIKSTTVTNQP